MTTPTVVLIAAAAFFIVICVVAIIILKKESKTRTASIKDIEKCINKMSHELTEGIKAGNSIAMDMNADIHCMLESSAAGIKEIKDNGFGSDNQNSNSAYMNETDEISFDFLEFDNLDSAEDLIMGEESNESAGEYITGKSGRKYTAEELEELIKE